MDAVIYAWKLGAGAGKGEGRGRGTRGGEGKERGGFRFLSQLHIWSDQRLALGFFLCMLIQIAFCGRECKTGCAEI